MTETPYNSVNDERLHGLIEWLAENNFSYNKLTTASADAGFRRYFRLHKDNSSLIAVDAPPEYEDTPAFIDIAARLAKSGLQPPQLLRYSTEKGFLVVEDLGQTHIQQALQNAPGDTNLAVELYQTSMQAIIQMQASTEAHGLPACDRRFLRSELELFPHWYLKIHLGQTITSDQQVIIDHAFDVLLDSASEQPSRFMHRDFHCRNLMVLDNKRIGIIDFQGAMIGPITYDPVSLLRDVYLDWPAEFQNTFIEQHRITLIPDVDIQTYTRWLDLMGLQRQLKILGIFCRLNYRDNKPDYLDNLARVCRQVTNTLAIYPQLSEFSQLFSHYNDNQGIV